MKLTRRHSQPESGTPADPSAPVDPSLPLDPDAGTEAAELVESEIPTSAPVVVLAAVNLLPRTYALRAEVRRAKIFALILVVVALLVTLLAWLVASQKEAAAQEALDVATAERAQLQAEAAKYSDVPRVFATVAAAEQQLQLAMGNEVRWSFFLNDLALTMPSGVSLDGLQVGSPTPGAPTAATAPSSASAAATSAGSSGAGVPGIGTMTVSAKAFTYNTVANWLDSLAKLPTLADPYVSTIATGVLEGTDIVTYGSTATLTPEALSQRYTAEEVAK